MYYTFFAPNRPTTPEQPIYTEDLFEQFWKTEVEPLNAYNMQFVQTAVYRDRWTVKVPNEFAETSFEKYFATPELFHSHRIQMEEGVNIANCYREFKIPKSTPGKYRTICEPCPELKVQQKAYQQFLEHVLHVLPHRSATAYVAGRSTKDDREVHQKNNSKWELKLDLENFFQSCNPNFTFAMLEQVYPFGVLAQKYPDTWRTVQRSLYNCFYKNGLPQGTPISPYLTNILMVPIDETIRETFTNFKGYHIEYTRYADDITLSCQYKFPPEMIIKELKKILKSFDAPFKINQAKTKYQSTNGRNWSLGIMRNKDNRLTVGHKNNQKLRAKIFQFYMDNLEQVTTPLGSAQKLQGLVSYYKMIDPDYTEHVLNKYSIKFGREFKDLMKEVLNH